MIKAILNLIFGCKVIHAWRRGYLGAENMKQCSRCGKLEILDEFTNKWL